MPWAQVHIGSWSQWRLCPRRIGKSWVLAFKVKRSRLMHLGWLYVTGLGCTGLHGNCVPTWRTCHPASRGRLGPKWERLLSLVWRMLSLFWKQVGQTADNWGLPTFTTSRPWGNPGRRPAGLGEIVRPMKLRGGSWTSIVSPLTSIETRQAWSTRRVNGGAQTLPSVKPWWGFPVGYTAPCAGKSAQKGEDYDGSRLTLLGNSWQVGVIVWLLVAVVLSSGALLSGCVARTSSRSLLPVRGVNCRPCFFDHRFIVRDGWKRFPPGGSSKRWWASLQLRERICCFKGVVSCWWSTTGCGPPFQGSYGNGGRWQADGNLPATTSTSWSYGQSLPPYVGGSNVGNVFPLGSCILLKA